MSFAFVPIRAMSPRISRCVPALAAPHFAAAADACTIAIEQGMPCWLYLVMLLCIWNAFKTIGIGPVSLIHLARVHQTETRHRPGSNGHDTSRASLSPAHRL